MDNFLDFHTNNKCFVYNFYVFYGDLSIIYFPEIVFKFSFLCFSLDKMWSGTVTQVSGTSNMLCGVNERKWLKALGIEDKNVHIHNII